MDKVSFFHQFAALLAAGLPVSRSLAMAAQSGTAAAFCQQRSQQVAAGSSLAEALRGRGTPFSPWELSLLHLGETSGALAEVSQQLASHAAASKRRARLLRSMTRSLGLAAAVAAGGLGWLLGGHWWGLALAAVAAGAVGLGPTLGLTGFAHLPGFRGIWEARSQIHLAELALPLRCGLSMDRAIELVVPRLPDPKLAGALQQAAAQVRRGRPLSQSLKGKVPSTTLQMIRTGEETGTLDTLLEKLGEYYEGELERQIHQLEGRLRPLGLLAMGAVVLVLGLRLLGQLLPS